MWLLVIIILSIGSEREKVIILEEYGNKYDCNVEKERVAGEMEIAYPGDTSYKIDCLKVPSKI